MGIAFRRPDATGTCCDDAGVKTSPCDPCAEVSAPCSLFIPDDTSFGVIELNQNGPDSTPSWCGEWTGLGPGSYSPRYVSGTFSAGSGPDFWVCKALSHSFPTLTGHTVLEDATYDFPLGLDSTIDSVSQADVEADYLARNSTMPTFPVADTGFPETFRIFHAATPDNPGGPSFDMVRFQKLRDPQPTTVALSLDSFSAGRWKVIYSGVATTGLTFTFGASSLESSLNSNSAIIVDGGVTVSGDPTGFVITWNNNGPRSLLDPQVTTRNPGVICTIARTQAGIAGPGGQPEIQTITVGSCSYCQNGSSLPEWDGSLPHIYLSRGMWRHQPRHSGGTPLSVTDDAPVARINGGKLFDCYLWLDGLDPGNVDAGKHSWVVTFVGPGGESGPGPASNHPTYDRDYVIPLSNVPIGPDGTTARNIYRTAAGDTGPYKLVGSISNNIVTDFDDNVADADLGATPPSPGVGDPPTTAPVAKVCIWRLLLMCLATVAGTPVRCAIWKGTKGGNDPTGDFTASNYGQLFASELCSLDQSHGVRKVTVTGADYVT